MQQHKYIVEFIGPRGVGKTTLAKHYFATHSHTVWQPLLTYADENPFELSPLDFIPEEQMLLELRLANHLAQRPTAMEVYDLTSLYFRHMKFVAQCRLRSPTQHLLSDEHLFQLFIVEFEHLLKNDPKPLQTFLNQRAFVFLDCQEEVIFRNQKQREAEGVYRPFFSRETEARQRQGTQWFKSKLPLLKSFAVANQLPFIEIDLDAGTPTALVQLTSFLKTLEK